MTKPSPVVRISDELREQAQELQQTRNNGDYVNDNSVNQNPTQDHLLGAIGELIVADWHGVDVDRESRYGDEGIDLIWNNGREDITIDVKTTKYASGSLVTPEPMAEEIKTSDEKEKPDIYILVRKQSEHEWEIAGWIESDRFLSQNTLCPMLSGGSGKNHKMDAAELHDISEPKTGLDLCRVIHGNGTEVATASN